LAQIGSTLRGARVQRGLTIEQVAQDTRISARFLEALEAETFEDLPAPVYVRGFLRSYANFLHVDPTPLLESLALGQGASPASANENGSHANGRRNGDRQDPFARNPSRPVAAANPHSVPVGAAPDGDTWDPDEVGPDPRHAETGGVAAVETFEEAGALEEPARYLDEPIPYRPRRVNGVLTEREGNARDPAATSRMLGIIAGIAIAAIAILALAVFLTGRGGNGGSSNAAAPTGDTPTPRAAGSVIALTSATVAASASPSSSASASPSASVTGTVSPTGTPGTPTPTKAAGAVGANPTPTQTPTPEPSPTIEPTATPTVFRTATPTRVPTPPPHGLGLSSCDLAKSLNQCGPPPVRVICYPPSPADEGLKTNDNWFVDIPRTYPLQPGWKEKLVTPSAGSVGDVIKAGQFGC
jgi:cytoskeletal protein RodZ